MRVIDRRAEMGGVAGSGTVVEADNNEFGQKMGRKRADGDFRVKLKNLLERIDLQAQKLSERLDIAELKRYRSLVTEFIDVSVRHSSEYKREHTLDGKGRHRIFGIIKKVDAELEALTREVLRGQKDFIGVLAKLEDIRGLLVDIIA
ncbi:MAG: YaaR family protein [Oscillospiraceae bacterium]|nr:YaaR family protein [Oscillospiraceae bacterium]